MRIHRFLCKEIYFDKDGRIDVSLPPSFASQNPPPSAEGGGGKRIFLQNKKDRVSIKDTLSFWS